MGEVNYLLSGDRAVQTVDTATCERCQGMKIGGCCLHKRDDAAQRPVLLRYNLFGRMRPVGFEFIRLTAMNGGEKSFKLSLLRCEDLTVSLKSLGLNNLITLVVKTEAETHARTGKRGCFLNSFDIMNEKNLTLLWTVDLLNDYWHSKMW